MTKIFAYKINNMLPEDKWQELISILSYSEKSRVNSFKKRSDAEVALLSRYILRQIISFYTGVSPKELIFSADTYGKPILKYPQTTNLYFNMSHSGDWIVGAVSRDKPIGIDIEKIRPIDFAITENCFNGPEIKYLNSKNGSKLDNFYKIWTLKESFIKAIGKGLHYSLKNFYFEFGPKGEINIKSDKEVGIWNFKFYEIDPGYKFAVCLGSDKFPKKVKILDI